MLKNVNHASVNTEFGSFLCVDELILWKSFPEMIHVKYENK